MQLQKTNPSPGLAYHLGSWGWCRNHGGCRVCLIGMREGIKSKSYFLLAANFCCFLPFVLHDPLGGFIANLSQNPLRNERLFAEQMWSFHCSVAEVSACEENPKKSCGFEMCQKGQGEIWLSTLSEGLFPCTKKPYFGGVEINRTLPRFFGHLWGSPNLFTDSETAYGYGCNLASKLHRTRWECHLQCLLKFAPETWQQATRSSLENKSMSNVYLQREGPWLQGMSYCWLYNVTPHLRCFYAIVGHLRVISKKSSSETLQKTRTRVSHTRPISAKNRSDCLARLLLLHLKRCHPAGWPSTSPTPPGHDWQFNHVISIHILDGWKHAKSTTFHQACRKNVGKSLKNLMVETIDFPIIRLATLDDFQCSWLLGKKYITDEYPYMFPWFLVYTPMFDLSISRKIPLCNKVNSIYCWFSTCKPQVVLA